MGSFRGGIRDAAVSVIPGHYSLSVDHSKPDDIDTLLIDDTYLYPCKPTGEVDNSRPYRHPAIVSIIKMKFFTGSTSIGYQHRNRFTSSIKEGSKALEMEVPAPIIALVATAVRVYCLSNIFGLTTRSLDICCYCGVSKWQWSNQI